MSTGKCYLFMSLRNFATSSIFQPIVSLLGKIGKKKARTWKVWAAFIDEGDRIGVNLAACQSHCTRRLC